MFNFSEFSSKPTLIFGILLAGTMLFTTEALAQEENHPRIADKPANEDLLPEQDVAVSTVPVVKVAEGNTGGKAGVQARKELPAAGILQEKDLKKQESPSTLSFNIFLYIVDKFKAD